MAPLHAWATERVGDVRDEVACEECIYVGPMVDLRTSMCEDMRTSGRGAGPSNYDALLTSRVNWVNPRYS